MFADKIGNGLKDNVTYDRRTARYRGADGRFLKRTDVLKLVDEEAMRLETRLKGHARNLTQGRIDLPTFQRRAAEDLKLSHVRMGILASGGRSLATSQTYGTVGRGLRSQYEYLTNFSNDLAAGKLTAKQAITRAGLYGASTRTAFHQSEKIAKGREGFIEAMRRLDPQARHCNSCLFYDTKGQWKPLAEVVMPTVNCECMNRCRCGVLFRKRPQNK